MNRESPVYSHNPYDSTKFPLLVLDVENNRSTPANEGFQVFHWHDEIQLIYVLKGQVDIKVFDEDLKLERNDCIFINRNAIHKVMGSEDCHYHSYIIPRKILSFFPGSIMEKNNVDPKNIVHIGIGGWQNDARAAAGTKQRGQTVLTVTVNVGLKLSLKGI